MTFNNIAWINIKKSFKKYLAYYLSGSFCITLFFMFSSLIFNKDIIGSAVSDYPLTAYFTVSIIAIFLFSVFFIFYAHFAFIKNRHKELGIYMISGMTNKDINRLLFLEILIIFGLSLFTGIITGSVFSRLLQLAVCKLLDLDKVISNTSIFTYFLSIISFVVIYGIVFLLSIVKINKMDINDLIHESRKKESSKLRKKDYILAIIGLITTLFSIPFMMSFAKDPAINTKFPYMPIYLLSTLVGLILSGYVIKVIISLTKKTKLYRKNLLVINQIEKKFNQNKRIILVLSILATLILLSVGASFALTSITDTIVIDGSYDVEYNLDDDIEYNSDIINQAINLHEIKERKEIEYIYLFDSSNNKKIIYKLSDYNIWNNSNYELKNDECFNIISSWEPGSHGVDVGSNCKLNNGDNCFNYKVVKSEKGKLFSNNLVNDSAIILSDEVYQNIIYVNKGKMIKINFTCNYSNTLDTITQIKNEIGIESIFSRYDNYKTLKSGYNTFLFVALTQSIMFFISTGCVLFFKQSNETEQNIEDYNKLYKIGITDNEIKKTISKELRIVYFIPPILGLIFGFSIMYYMLNLFTLEGQANLIEKQFLSKGLIAWFGYLLFQILFYFITRKNSFNSIIKNKELS